MKKSSKIIVFFAAMAITIGSLAALRGHCYQECGPGTAAQHGCDSHIQHHGCAK